MTGMIVLEATKRELQGKKVRHLRRQGVIPGVLYGPTIDSVPLQMKWTDLRLVLKRAGGSNVIELALGDETYNALVRNVQRDPLRGDVLHVDFYRVRMDVAIRADIPIVTVGDARRIVELGGVVTQEMTTVMVECLPTNLPSEIRVNVDELQEVGDSIVAAQLPTLEGVQYHIHEDDVVVSTSYLESAPAAEEEELEEELGGTEPEVIGRAQEEDFED